MQRLAPGSNLCTWLAASVVALLAVLWVPQADAQTGIVAGTVIDATTGEPLPGTNVVVVGTTIGAATDFDGRYRIAGVPTGDQRLAAVFLGFEPDTLAVTVVRGQTNTLDFDLRPQAIRGQEVEITAQLEGQLAAINEQRSSNTLVNVVSEDRIRELPDQNAAESVGRLPGVSLQRDGGEGTKVQIRGLAPNLSSVTINGERIPGTEGSGDFDGGSRGGGRAVDLSLISSDLLAGIELFKALTPDKDADAIGGTVNLVVREAPVGFRGRVRALGGYNALGDRFDAARFDANASNRFFGDRLGLIATANYQRTPRGTDALQNDFETITINSLEEGGAGVEIDPRSIEVLRRDEVRTRYGASLTTDYRLPNGNIQVRGLYSRTERDEQQQRIRYRIEETDAERAIRERLRTVDLLSGGLSGTYTLPFAEIDATLSAARALNRTPEGWDARFRQDDAFPGGTDGFGTLPLATIADSAGIDVGQTYLRALRRDRERAVDRDLTAALNIAVPYRLSPQVNGTVKFGGKWRGKQRTQNFTRTETLPDDLRDAAAAQGLPFREDGSDNEGPAAPTFFETGFADPVEGFLIYETPDYGRIGDLDASLDGVYLTHPFFDQRDFEAEEDVTAAYLMTEVNAGPLLVVGGVRYEHTRVDFTAQTGGYSNDLQRLLRTFENAQRQNPDTTLRQVFGVRDTTGVQDYGQLFPQVVARYRITPTLDLRAAVTRTLARPDYLDLVAYENVDDINFEIERGNPTLRPTTAWNYDLSLTAYTGYGLASIGGFYKQLTDFQYDSFANETIDGIGFLVFQTVNGNAATVWGIELETQLNFTFLPRPLDGFLLNANYAYAQSEADFPISYLVSLDPQTFAPTYTTDTRTDALPGQAPHVANVTLGYEKAGFSARVSLSVQSGFLAAVASSEFDQAFLTFQDDPSTPDVFEFDLVYDDPRTPDVVEGGPITQAEVRTDFRTQTFTFLDLQVSQDVPGVDGLRLIFNANNLTDQNERERLGAFRDLADRRFGWTGEVGVQFKF
ncbi:MAG: TonB-dependent receptor [Bacteroidota bacterium]